MTLDSAAPMRVPATPRVESRAVAVTAARALAVTWTPDGRSEGALSGSSSRRDSSSLSGPVAGVRWSGISSVVLSSWRMVCVGSSPGRGPVARGWLSTVIASTGY
nr:hypothetical protein DA06_03220 [Georgenia sp. SUBG003]